MYTAVEVILLLYGYCADYPWLKKILSKVSVVLS